MVTFTIKEGKTRKQYSVDGKKTNETDFFNAELHCIEEGLEMKGYHPYQKGRSSCVTYSYMKEGEET